MPDLTKDLITLENPDHPEDDFRQNNKGKINRVSTINYGNGVNGKVGLLRGSGHEAVYAYTFNDEKYDEDSAKEWLDNHRSKKAMKDVSFKNKKFTFNLPMTKSPYRADDGFLYIEYALATTDVDLEGEQLTDKALNDMVKQATSINMYLDHKYDLDHTIGPVVEASIDNNELWVKGRVRKEMEAKIADILESETNMGGSFGGFCEEDFLENGIRKLDKVRLLDATFTSMPTNTATSGTGKISTKTCSVCNQIFKSIEKKYGFKRELEVKNVKSEDESYDALMSAVNAAVRAKYRGPDGYSSVWLKLTFPDSCIVENWEEDKLYEIPYTINDAGDVELGEPVEVMEQYVEKKLEVFKTKAIEHEPPADYKKKTKGDESMDEKEVQKMIDESNDALFDKIKGLIKPETPKETPEVKTKSIDKDEMVKDITNGVLKALGFEAEEESEPEDPKLIIMDQKAFSEMRQEDIQKAILGIAKPREGTRKSKSLGGPKFILPGETETPEDEDKSKTATGKVTTRKAAEYLLKNKGIIA